jgi:hypothetical protein
VLVDPEDEFDEPAPDDPEPAFEDVDDADSAFFSPEPEPEPEPESEPEPDPESESFAAAPFLPDDAFAGSRLSLR